MAQPKVRKVGSNPPDGFEVTVEQTIGFVSFSDVGSNGPTEEALRHIGYHYEQTDNDGTYRFPGPGELEVINVTIRKERANESL